MLLFHVIVFIGPITNLGKCVAAVWGLIQPRSAGWNFVRVGDNGWGSVYRQADCRRHWLSIGSSLVAIWLGILCLFLCMGNMIGLLYLKVGLAEAARQTPGGQPRWGVKIFDKSSIVKGSDHVGHSN